MLDGLTLSDYSVDGSFSHVVTVADLSSALSTARGSIWDSAQSAIDTIASSERVRTSPRGGMFAVGPGKDTLCSSVLLDTLPIAIDVVQKYSAVWVANAQQEMSYHIQRGTIVSSGNSNIHRYAHGDRVVVTEEGIAEDENTWGAAESLLDRSLDTSLQDDEQSHRTTEAGYKRTQQTTIQNDRQSWEASESLLDRTSETNLQDAEQVHLASEAGYKRSSESTLQSDQFLWEAAETLLDRTLSTDLQDDEQAHKTSESGYLRTHKTTLQNDRQSWESAESLLDRSAETTLQDAEQLHRTTEAGYARSAKSSLASDQYSFEAAQSLLDRTSETNLQNDEQSHRSSQAVLTRNQKQTVSSDQYAWELGEAELDNTHKQGMLLKQLRLDFLVALVGQIADETLKSRANTFTATSGTITTYRVAVDPVPVSYLSANRFPLLWTADGELATPLWAYWKELRSGDATGESDFPTFSYKMNTQKRYWDEDDIWVL